MADEKNRAALGRNGAHLSQAFALEFCVAYREDLVHHKDFRVQVRRDGKGKADGHIRSRSPLDGGVDVLLDTGEINYFIEFSIDFSYLHAHNGAVQIYVFSAGQFWMEAGPDFEEAGNSPFDLNGSLRGSGDTELIIFRSVDFPAPFPPIIPTASPSLT